MTSLASRGEQREYLCELLHDQIPPGGGDGGELPAPGARASRRRPGPGHVLAAPPDQGNPAVPAGPDGNQGSRGEGRPPATAHRAARVLVERRLLRWLIGASLAWLLFDFAYYGNTIPSLVIVKLVAMQASRQCCVG